MRTTKLLLSASALLALACLPSPAAATNHEVQIEEVMAGAFGRTDVQFIEIKIPCGQNQWGPTGPGTVARAKLAFFDEEGNQVGEFFFPTNAPDSCDSVLIGTQAYADLASAPDPDFIMPAGILPGSGKVCFRGTSNPLAFHVVLCLSYGDFTGDTEEGTGINAPAMPGTNICALKRFASLTSFGQPMFNDDFALSTPAPRNAADETGAVVIPPHFADVPASHTFFRFIEALANAGVTRGCGGGNYCPGSNATRQEMAAFLLRGKFGGDFQPPACTTQVFDDVPCSNSFSRWINELFELGITKGCGGGNYCPFNNVTRQEMAAFLLRAKLGGDFDPPACTVPVFGDVPCSNPFSKWINELAAQGITNGCGGGNFCPTNLVTRAEMAAFLSRTFALPVPSTAACPGPPPEPADDHGNTAGTATALVVGAAPTSGEIQPAEEVDFFSFAASSGQTLVIETSDLGSGMDTVLTLFGTDGTTFLAENDDFNGLASRITRTFSSGGTFFVRVRHFSAGGTGTYAIRVRTP